MTLSRGCLVLVPLIACNGDDPADADLSEGDADTDADADADSDADSDADADVPLEGYAFESREDGLDSVSNPGQMFRQVLISDMKSHLDGLTARLDGGFFPVPGEVAGELDFYFSFDSATSGTVDLLVDTTPPPLQTVYDDVSSDKDLVAKIAGNDAVGQHKDWSTELVGWTAPGITTPESLVRAWFDQIDAAAIDWSNGDPALDPTGAPVPAVYVTSDGTDLQQLLEKFLRASVSFSQGTDDYLDSDEPGKGLLSDHTKVEKGKNYTALEHAWDEGFGYFGAARMYGDWSDELIADPGYTDHDADGSIDLLREICHGHSANAGKRDLGSVVATDFTADAYQAFFDGRTLLADTDTTLDGAQLADLESHRDRAVDAWEKAIAATVVHYINEVLVDMTAMGTEDYDFGDHAKHWSEMKGFALSFQFNPRSAVADPDFVALHQLLGQAPVLASAPPPVLAQAMADLVAARTILGDAFAFDPANLGEANGANGW